MSTASSTWTRKPASTMPWYSSCSASATARRGLVDTGALQHVRRLLRELGVVLGVELRERQPVAARGQEVAVRERDHARLDPADPFIEVGDPGRLAHLAVVDDVDADLGLAPDDVLDRAFEDLGVRRLVV
jgi:hypothetical protein